MKLFGKRTDQKQIEKVQVSSEAGAEASPVGKSSSKESKLALLRLTKRKVALLIVVVLLIASVGGLLTTKRKEVTNFIAGKRCDDAVIDQYNSANRSIDKFADEIKTVATSVESKAGYARDISCVYIVYTHYSYKQDATRSRQLLETMKTLKQQGKTIDAKILDQKSFEDMEMYVKSLEHNRDIGDKRDGSG